MEFKSECQKREQKKGAMKSGCLLQCKEMKSEPNSITILYLCLKGFHEGSQVRLQSGMDW